MGDGVCDESSNIPECDWDGGDCCVKSCMDTCQAKNLTGKSCRCGKSFYSCKTKDSDCYKCIHGICTKDPSDCYTNTSSIRAGIYACVLNTNTFGNTNSSDFYCGKDPFRNETHFGNNPTFHFPGCGYKSINCTEIPCCEMVSLNEDTPENCDDTVKERFVYDTVI